MTVCGFCVTNVLRSTESWDTHQKSYDHLASSAKEGCVFCTRLYDDVKRLLKLDHVATAAALPDETWPLYRWSARTLAKFRERGVCVRITFRPMAPVAKNGEASNLEPPHDGAGTDPRESLAPRMFCLFPEDGTVDVQTDQAEEAVKTAAERVQRWMRMCDSPDHDSCHFDARRSIDEPAFLPTRLLHVGGDGRGPFRVVETKGSAITGPYATLSHRWAEGMKSALTTPTTKQAYFDEGVSWDELGPKFQQAVEMARFIGVSYIWIDSLCIIQKDLDVDCQEETSVDFQKEGGLMHKVYRHSFCNIALECSDTGEMGTWTGKGGMLRQPYHVGVENAPPGTRKVELAKYAADGSSPMLGKMRWMIAPSDLWERDLLKANIYGRGWIFQERMLSPRILHLTRTQMFWDCPSMSASEAFPQGLPRPLDKESRYDRHWRGRLQDAGNLGRAVGPNDDEPIQDFWQEAVKKYTQCVLTNKGDKLIAIWSVAKLVRDVLNSGAGMTPRTQYCAGLWEPGLADQLAWRLAGRPEEKAAENKEGFPSWSWASQEAAIDVPDRLTLWKHFEAGTHAQAHAALKMDIRTPDSDDVQPVLRSSALKMQAHVGRAAFRRGPNHRTWTLRIQGVQDAKLEAFPDVVPPNGDGRPSISEPFFVVTAAKQHPLSTRPFYIDARGRYVPLDDMQPREGGRIGEEEEQKGREMVYEGMGILLSRCPSAEAQEYRFRRVGAFRFWEAQEDEWEALRDCCEEFRGGEYDACWGLRFHLV